MKLSPNQSRQQSRMKISPFSRHHRPGLAALTVMPETPYKRQVEIVQRAIERLRSETDVGLIGELEDEQLAAGTSLEWYGITKVVFERFVASRPLSDETRNALQEAVHAVRVIYGSATA